MGLLDKLGGLFGSKKNDALEAIKDGKVDVNDVKNVVKGTLDSNRDGQLTPADLDVNQDGKTDLNDLNAVKDKLSAKE